MNANRKVSQDVNNILDAQIKKNTFATSERSMSRSQQRNCQWSRQNAMHDASSRMSGALFKRASVFTANNDDNLQLRPTQGLPGQHLLGVYQ